MKSLKTKLSILLIMLVTTLLSAQVEKTLVKSFNLQGHDVVTLDLKGDVEVQEWNNKIIRVQMVISLDGGSNAMLKSLVQIGRYNLKSKIGESEFLVYAPGMNKEIRLKDRKLNEKVSYLVYAPSNVNVKVADEASTDNGTTNKSSSL